MVRKPHHRPPTQNHNACIGDTDTCSNHTNYVSSENAKMDVDIVDGAGHQSTTRNKAKTEVAGEGETVATATAAATDREHDRNAKETEKDILNSFITLLVYYYYI